jgi:carboxymethylenebutenolidase
MRPFLAFAAVFVFAGCYRQHATTEDEHASHAATVTASAEGALAQPSSALPPDATGAAARVQSSPRHGEWVVIKTSPTDSLISWVVYPERSTKAPVVIVVHEIFGLSTWVRGVADQLAADGFIAIAPDLMTMKRGGDLTAEWASDSARAAIRTLNADDVHRDISAIAKYGIALPAALPKYGVVGYCWGGFHGLRARGARSVTRRVGRVLRWVSSERTPFLGPRTGPRFIWWR